MPIIKSDTVERIRDAARIDEVVGEFVPLKKRGVNLIGVCPFHDEKTPSFTVSPVKGLFKCFGCGKGGDSVRFLMEHEHFSYPEALRYLARKYNIPIEEVEESPEEKAEQSRKEALFAVNTFAEQYFIENLWESDKGKAIGLSYFTERGFSDETIKKFRLGYSLESWDHLQLAAKEKGYKEEYLKEVGLVSKGERAVDIYRGRVMFPIHNLSGRVLGFGGRILTSEKTAKYINSPESEIYSKSKVLYGLFFAKKEIITRDNCYLVEGYTDVISMHQAGIQNVVASSGTSLTTDQIRLIRRFTPNITILYDGDSAGIKASFRGIDMILEEGMQVKVVLFPDGDDPDSYSKKHSTEELKTFLAENEKDFIGFKAGLLLKDAGTDPIRKASVVREMVESMALVSDAIARSIYVKECSRLMDVDERSIYTELNKILRKKYQKRQDEGKGHNLDLPDEEARPEGSETDVVFKDDGVNQEREVFRIFLNYGMQEVGYPLVEEGEEVIEGQYKIAEIIVSELTDEVDWKIPLHAEMFNEMTALVSADKMHEIQGYFLSHDREEVRNLAIDLVSQKFQLSPNWGEKYEILVAGEETELRRTTLKAVYNLKQVQLKLQMDALLEQLKNMDGMSREDQLTLIKRKQELDTINSFLSKHLTRVINL